MKEQMNRIGLVLGYKSSFALSLELLCSLRLRFSRGNPYALENLRLLLDSRADPNNLSKLGGQSASDSRSAMLIVWFPLLSRELTSQTTAYNPNTVICHPREI